MKATDRSTRMNRKRTETQTRFRRGLICRFGTTLIALFAVCSTPDSMGAPVIQPSLRPLLKPGKWPAWSRGEPADISVLGEHAYVALRSGGLAVYNVGRPSDPLQVGNVLIQGTRSGGAIGVAVSGQHACVVKGEDGMDVVDVSNPATPRVVGTHRGSCADVALSGRYAYVASWGQGLSIVDLFDPRNPREVSRYNEPLVGERFNTVVVSGDHAFVSGEDWTGSEFHYFVHAIDVSNPTNCLRVGSYATRGDIAVSGKHIYVNEGASGFKVIDFSDPSRPAQVGHYDQPGEEGPLAVSGNYVYVARGTEGLEILDVSDPSHPMRAGGYAGVCMDLAVSGSQVYMVDGEGWEIVDATNPSSPVRTADWTTVGGYATAVAVSGDVAYLADGGFLRIIDAREPHLPISLGGYEIGGLAKGVAVSGNYAYVADAWHGLQVIDVSDPANCRRVAGDPPNGLTSALDIALFGNHLYVARDRGVLIFDISAPAVPVKIGEYDLGATARAVFVASDRAYVAADTNGLVILDVSDPTHCVRLSQVSIRGSVTDVVVGENRAYVAYASNGNPKDLEMVVLDIADPAHPVWLAEIDDFGIYSLALSHHHLYITIGYAASGGGLLVLDLNAIPTELEEWDGMGVFQDLGWPGMGLVVSNGRAYVAVGPAGLRVIPTIPDVQFSVRVVAPPDTPFTLEAAIDLSTPNPWFPLATAKATTTPFDFVDYDVKASRKPRKYYRVRTPQ